MYSKLYGKLHKIKKIGEGSYGKVYLVNDIKNNLYALKYILNDTECDYYTIREIDSLQKLRGIENVTQILDVTQDLLSTRILLEYCNSGNLTTYISENYKNVNYKHLTKYLIFQLILGLNQIHKLGIIHRDIKPENILINSAKSERLRVSDLQIRDFGTPSFPNVDTKLKICDFSLACSNTKYINPAKTPRMVTLWYRSPEILINGDKYDEKCDVWSVGCVVYKMITGMHLFTGDNEDEIITKISNKTDSDSKVILNLDKYDLIDKSNLIDLINKMLIIKPNKRWNCELLLQHQYFNEFVKPVISINNIKPFFDPRYIHQQENSARLFANFILETVYEFSIIHQLNILHLFTNITHKILEDKKNYLVMLGTCILLYFNFLNEDIDDEWLNKIRNNSMNYDLFKLYERLFPNIYKINKSFDYSQELTTENISDVMWKEMIYVFKTLNYQIPIFIGISSFEYKIMKKKWISLKYLLINYNHDKSDVFKNISIKNLYHKDIVNHKPKGLLNVVS